MAATARVGALGLVLGFALLGMQTTTQSRELIPTGEAGRAGAKSEWRAEDETPRTGHGDERRLKSALHGTWQVFASPDDIRGILIHGAEAWLATYGGGLVHWRGDGTWRQYMAPQDGLPSNDVRDVVRWRGTVWAATAKGLARLSAPEERLIPVDIGVAQPNVTALLVDAEDRLWLATAQRRLSPEAEGATGASARWSGGGVAVTANGTDWWWFDVQDGLPSRAIRDLALWRGEVWLASEPYWSWREAEPAEGRPGRWELVGGGLAVYQQGRWRVFNQSAVSALSDSASYLAAGATALWIGTSGKGVVAYDGRRWYGHTDCGQPTRCVLDNYVTALAVGADGAVWLGTARFNGRGTGLQVLDDGGTPTEPNDDAWFAWTTADGLPGERTNAIAVADDGTVWLGMADWDARAQSHGAGLVRLMPDRRRFVRNRLASMGAGTLIDNDVTCLAFEPNSGELWVGTSFRGLSVRDPAGRWRHYDRGNTGGGLASNDIADIVFEPTGVLWVATRQMSYDAQLGVWSDGGLSRYDGQKWQRLSAAETGLPSDQLSALALDGRGRLWVGTGATDYGEKEHRYRGWGLAVLETAGRKWLRTYSYPELAGDNVTDLAVGEKLWLAAAYAVRSANGAGDAPLHAGGGASAYDLQSGLWRTYGEADGLTPAMVPPTGQPPIFDYRAVVVDRDGRAWLGGLTYPGQPQADEVPDGLVDMIGPGGPIHARFPASGPVTALDIDDAGIVWALTRDDGLRLFTAEGWWRLTTAEGLPFDGLTALVLRGGEVWLGGANTGLARLVGDGPWIRPEEPTPAAPPTVSHPRHAAYLPIARR